MTKKQNKKIDLTNITAGQRLLVTYGHHLLRGAYVFQAGGGLSEAMSKTLSQLFDGGPRTFTLATNGGLMSAVNPAEVTAAIDAGWIAVTSRPGYTLTISGEKEAKKLGVRAPRKSKTSENAKIDTLIHVLAAHGARIDVHPAGECLQSGLVLDSGEYLGASVPIIMAMQFGHMKPEAATIALIKLIDKHVSETTVTTN